MSALAWLGADGVVLARAPSTRCTRESELTMGAIEDDDGWYRRMAERAAARRGVEAAESHANTRRQPIHLHGTMTVCPCGAETGITCVAHHEGYMEPRTCPACGKPCERWGDTRPWRTDITEHRRDCRAHPDVTRCRYCGGPLIGGGVYSDTGQYHFGHAPGAETWDSAAEVWRDREGRARHER